MKSNQKPSRSTQFLVILSFAGAIALGLARLFELLVGPGHYVGIVVLILLQTVLLSPFLGGYALYRVLRAPDRTPTAVRLTVLGLLSSLAILIFFFVSIGSALSRI